MSDRDLIIALQIKVAQLERKVELLMRHTGLPYQDEPIAPAMAAASEAIARGNKLEAIRVYREATGCELKEAKDAIDALASKMGAG